MIFHCPPRPSRYLCRLYLHDLPLAFYPLVLTFAFIETTPSFGWRPRILVPNTDFRPNSYFPTASSDNFDSNQSLYTCYSRFRFSIFIFSVFCPCGIGVSIPPPCVWSFVLFVWLVGFLPIVTFSLSPNFRISPHGLNLEINYNS